MQKIPLSTIVLLCSFKLDFEMSSFVSYSLSRSQGPQREGVIVNKQSPNVKYENSLLQHNRVPVLNLKTHFYSTFRMP